MKCYQCGERASVKCAKTNEPTCVACFVKWFEEDVHKTILTCSIFKHAYVLNKLNRDYDYGLDLLLLSIDEGITGYRDDSLKAVERNEVEYGIPLTIVSYKDLYGWTMDEIVSKIGKKNNCTFCGVFRRQALDRGAFKLGAAKIVTGHNADDMAETILLNVLRGDVGRLQRCTNAITGADGTLPRAKPLKYSYEKDIVMYAHFKKLDYFCTECIYAPNAYRNNARVYVKDLERSHWPFALKLRCHKFQIALGVDISRVRHLFMRYSSLSQDDDATSNEAQEERFNMYQSAFTYADYGDVDNMGYQGLGRHRTHHGSRYQRFTYSKMPQSEPFEGSSSQSPIEIVFIFLSFALFVCTLPFSLLFSIKIVSNFERLVVLRLGRAQKLRGPGTTFVLPCIDRCTKVDVRVSAFNVPPLQIITADRGLVELGASVYLKVEDPLMAVCSVRDTKQNIRTLACTMLYRYVSKLRVSDVSNPHKRRMLIDDFKRELHDFTNAWGIHITDVELSDVKIMQEGENQAMNALSQVMKSELGTQIINTIGSHVQEFAEKMATENPDFPGSSGQNLVEPEVPDPTPKQEEVDVDTLVTQINLVIDINLVALIGRVFQIECADFGDFYVDVKNGQGHAERGHHGSPDVTLKLSKFTFFQLVREKMSPMQAYMNGSLKIQGGVNDAIQLKYIAERLKHLL
ncbi:hypothetical protein QR680_002530 [Steinernema hermaphroditum]|uniref:Band 7 domain-containing protein n=1 Tax=Steinernema hermaphroditum TaxID=289476 RepID=A0AA39LIA2_9BILA|nr:hypothetical protein QR680_002530 [Steinernema hermaphroditum]